MTAEVVFWVCAGLIAWVYVGYPLLLAVVGRVRPRPRARAPLFVPVSVIVAAHDEERIIADKVDNIRSSGYPRDLLEVVVVSDGSTDGTVRRARDAAADVVLDLPRVGKLRALNAAVAHSSGAILAFTDADSVLPPATLGELVANFSDPEVGAVAANEVHITGGDGGVGRGEGLYWRYEQKLKQLEDRVGSAVSASGRLYAMRRDVFEPSTLVTGTDDFVLSTQAVRAGKRIAFDAEARVLVAAPEDSGTELRRKVRVMNRGMRAAISLATSLPRARTMYLLQLIFHKILRRCVAFLLVGLLLAPIALVLQGHTAWWFTLAPQLVFYALALGGAIADRSGRRVAKPLWIPYYFCLANLAAGIAVVSLVRGRKYEMWEPALARGNPALPESGP
jgi:cellulose synthase/poly-beta-1,6-N-acetylglucosamine synthase-like glycosyltransferase